MNHRHRFFYFILMENILIVICFNYLLILTGTNTKRKTQNAKINKLF